MSEAKSAQKKPANEGRLAVGLIADGQDLLKVPLFLPY